MVLVVAPLRSASFSPLSFSTTRFNASTTSSSSVTRLAVGAALPAALAPAPVHQNPPHPPVSRTSSPERLRCRIVPPHVQLSACMHHQPRCNREKIHTSLSSHDVRQSANAFVHFPQRGVGTDMRLPRTHSRPHGIFLNHAVNPQLSHLSFIGGKRNG